MSREDEYSTTLCIPLIVFLYIALSLLCFFGSVKQSQIRKVSYFLGYTFRGWVVTMQICSLLIYFLFRVSPNLVLRVLSYPPYGARERNEVESANILGHLSPQPSNSQPSPRKIIARENSRFSSLIAAHCHQRQWARRHVCFRRLVTQYLLYQSEGWGPWWIQLIF